jgi:hypothetical protein
LPNSVRNFNHDEIRIVKIQSGNGGEPALSLGRNGCRAGLGLGGAALAAAKEPADWPGITGEVLADQPVATARSLMEQADGFHRLAITLSNNAICGIP